MGKLAKLLIVTVLVAGFAVRRSELRTEELEFRRLSESLDARIAAFESRERPRRPIVGEPVPGEAWDHYRRAFPLLAYVDDYLLTLELDDDFTNEVQEALDDLAINGSPAPEALRAYRELAEPAFLQLSLGARAEEVGVGRDLSSGSDPFAADEEICAATDALEPLRVRAALLAGEGDLAGAVETLLVLHRFGEDLGDLPGLVHHLMGTTVQGRALAALSELTGTGRLADHLLDRILEHTKGSRAEPGVVLTGVRLSDEAALRHFARGHPPPAWEWVAWPPSEARTPGDFLRWWSLYRKASDAALATTSPGDSDLYDRYGRALGAGIEGEATFKEFFGLPDFAGLARLDRIDGARRVALRIGIDAVRAARCGRRWTPPKTGTDLVIRQIDGRSAIFLAIDLENAEALGQEPQPFFRLR